jgi:hypothetical protein
MRKLLALTALGLAGSLGLAACHNGSPASPGASGYPSSAQNTIVSDCQQSYGAPVSYCQCNLSWLEANIPYSMFAQDPATYEQQADSDASC